MKMSPATETTLAGARLEKGDVALPSGRNVFGCAFSNLEEEVDGQPTETDQRHKVKAQERYDKKKAAVEALLRRQDVGRLAEPTAQLRQEALPKRRRTLEAELDPRWRPTTQLPARYFVRHCGGIHRFFF